MKEIECGKLDETESFRNSEDVNSDVSSHSLTMHLFVVDFRDVFSIARVENHSFFYFVKVLPLCQHLERLFAT